MGILTRYLIRSHVGPFLFALGALTGLLFLNAVAQRLSSLVGKGLGWQVIGEFMLLSLPHTIALTLPMAVLIAVLYTFAELTSSSEITAMAAGGVRPLRLLLPVLGIGAILAAVTLYFNDRILPEANHELRNLLIDVGNKSPTFQLRDQVVNPIETGDMQTRYFLQATSIDQASNTMEDVVIFDVSNPAKNRSIYAERGEMAFNEEQTDLYLTLHDGAVYETDADRWGALLVTAFTTQVIPLRGVSDVMERSGASMRSDREMSIGMLEMEAARQRRTLEQAGMESRERSVYAVRKALGLPIEGDTAETRPFISTGTALPDDGMTRGVTLKVRTQASRQEVSRAQASRFRVEIHKKFAIATACFIFVLIGAPLAIRFPRGGVGMVITVSVAVFGVYWMGLIGGEDLADRGMLTPFWAMWTPNLICLALGLWLVKGMGRSASTLRGGGMDEWVARLVSWLPFGRRRSAA